MQLEHCLCVMLDHNLEVKSLIPTAGEGTSHTQVTQSEVFQGIMHTLNLSILTRISKLRFRNFSRKDR